VRALCLARIAPALLLMACAAAPRPDLVERRAVGPMPPMKTFSAAHPAAPTKSNRNLAQDYLELAFQMESGDPLDAFSRFEGPVLLRVTGDVPPFLQPDLDRLLDRLSLEAGIPITQVSPEQAANITIEVISAAQIRRFVPHAACFVVPRVSSWREYRANRNRSLTDWRTLREREKITIFLPGDVSPQNVRDCLHEELAQALGPLNDLYRLPDTVFNDDNFHTVLTGFDMLMLRVHYSPRLRNGMSRAEVAAELPDILRSLHPAGERRSDNPVRQSPGEWRDAISRALAPGTGARQRIRSVEKAMEIARAAGWNDNRTAFTLSVRGRLLASSDPQRALASFFEAYEIYSARRDTRIHAAHIAAHLAIFALSAGDAEQALALTRGHAGIAERAENASLLATLLAIRSEALRTLGFEGQANAARRSALGWARYGFGSDAAVWGHVDEIERIARRSRYAPLQGNAGEGT